MLAAFLLAVLITGYEYGSGCTDYGWWVFACSGRVFVCWCLPVLGGCLSVLFACVGCTAVGACCLLYVSGVMRCAMIQVWWSELLCPFSGLRLEIASLSRYTKIFNNSRFMEMTILLPDIWQSAHRLLYRSFLRKRRVELLYVRIVHIWLIPHVS